MAAALRPFVIPLMDTCRDPSRQAEKRLQARKNENEEVVE
jgi:hypothetical protein